MTGAPRTPLAALGLLAVPGVLPAQARLASDARGAPASRSMKKPLAALGLLALIAQILETRIEQ